MSPRRDLPVIEFQIDNIAVIFSDATDREERASALQGCIRNPAFPSPATAGRSLRAHLSYSRGSMRLQEADIPPMAETKRIAIWTQYAVLAADVVRYSHLVGSADNSVLAEDGHKSVATQEPSSQAVQTANDTSP